MRRLNSILLWRLYGAIRNLRTENNVKPGASVESPAQIDDAGARDILQRGTRVYREE